jgi:hypothetical protein
MKYIVISLYDGTHSVETELDDESFEGMDCIESDEAIVWRGEEVMIVTVKE